MEAEGLSIPLKNQREHSLAVTKVSPSIYKGILKETSKIADNLSCSYSPPQKIRPRVSRKLDLIPSQIKYIGELVYNFCIVEKRRLTLKLILEKLE